MGLSLSEWVLVTCDHALYEAASRKLEFESAIKTPSQAKEAIKTLKPKERKKHGAT